MGEPRWIERARRSTEVRVSPAQQGEIIAGITRAGRRRRGWAPLALAVAGLSILVGGLAYRTGRDGPTAAVSPAPAAAPPLRFDEGATGVVVGVGEAFVAERTRARTRVEVRRGAIRFEVAPTGREFRVEAGPIAVIVVGTAFTVERRADAIGVTVQRGRVRVERGTERVLLGAGESRWYALTTPPAVSPRASAPSSSAAAAPVPVSSPRAPAPARWQTLARRGEYDEAFALLRQRGAGPRDDVEELLLAADAARHSAHWAEAIPYYDRVLARYPRDARAGLAAFAKARLLLHQLGRPVAAAQAFAAAQGHALPQGLVEDALAREAEAWARAGHGDRARARASEYLRRYPGGPARDRARALAGEGR